jgi:hypothetical protein
MKFALIVIRTSQKRSINFDISGYEYDLKANETILSTTTKTKINVKKYKSLTKQAF